MHCNVIRDLLPLYADDLCSDESRAEVDRHLESCDACRGYYEELLCPLPDPVPADDHGAVLLKKLRRTLRRYTLIPAALAVLALGLLLAFAAPAAVNFEVESSWALVGIFLLPFTVFSVSVLCGQTGRLPAVAAPFAFGLLACVFLYKYGSLSFLYGFFPSLFGLGLGYLIAWRVRVRSLAPVRVLMGVLLFPLLWMILTVVFRHEEESAEISVLWLASLYLLVPYAIYFLSLFVCSFLPFGRLSALFLTAGSVAAAGVLLLLLFIMCVTDSSFEPFFLVLGAFPGAAGALTGLFAARKAARPAEAAA